MKIKLKTQLSLAIALPVLLIVGIISLVFNVFIARQFKEYKISEQDKNMRELTRSIRDEYNPDTKNWNQDYIQAIGMYAMNNGYIVKLTDQDGKIIWDAQACDQMSCHQVMNAIEDSMNERYPDFKGGYTTASYDLKQSGTIIGTVTVQYFSPYFLTEYDFSFLNALNVILGITGIVSLILAACIGFMIARRLSHPILNTAKTAKKIAEGDLSARIQEETMTREVKELIHSVNHMAATIANLETLRKQTTADVAHELRTPLTTLQTHLEAMAEGIWEPTHERLTSCSDEILRISKLVNDLEKLAKTESDILRLNLTVCDIRQIAERAVSISQMDIKNKNLVVEITGSCDMIYVDEDRMLQVLLNLLSNAVKYTKKQGKITINISCESDYAIIGVKDNGSGIPKEDLPYVFERFYRADKSRSRSTGGSGIGLAIVKAIVTAHNGMVSVNSELGNGTEVIVKLPR